MRQESSQRLLLSMTLLAALWIVVYWSWGPRDITPTLSFDLSTAAGDEHSVIAPNLSETLAHDQEGQDGSPGGVLGQLQRSGTESEQQPGQVLRVQPPQFRSYTVRSGETFEDIAQAAFGDRTLWRAIAEANPLKDAERIKAGDVIRIPLDPSNIQGVVVTQDGERVDPPAAALPEFVEYVVKSGDTLGEIAQQYYGTARNANLIFEANRDSLRSIDDLKLGQTLRLPAAPSPEG